MGEVTKNKNNAVSLQRINNLLSLCFKFAVKTTM